MENCTRDNYLIDKAVTNFYYYGMNNFDLYPFQQQVAYTQKWMGEGTNPVQLSNSNQNFHSEFLVHVHVD